MRLLFAMGRSSAVDVVLASLVVCVLVSNTGHLLPAAYGYIDCCQYRDLWI